MRFLYINVSKKYPVKQIANIFSGNISTLLLLAIFGLLSTRWLQPADRGLVLFTTSVVSVCAIFATLGFGIEGRRHIAQGVNPQFVSTSFVLSVVSGISSAAFLFISASLTGTNIENAMLVAACALGFFSTLASLLRDGLYGYSEYRYVAVIQGSGWTLQLGMLVAVAALHSLTPISTVVILATGSALITVGLIIRILVVSRHLQNRRVASIFQKSKMISALITIGSAQYFISGDRLIVGFRTSPSELAYYGVAATISSVPLLIATSLAQYLQTHSATNASSIRSKNLWLVFGVTLSLAVVIAIFSTQIITLLVGGNYAPANTPLKICLLGSPLYAVFLIVQAYEVGRGNYKNIVMVSLLGVTLSVAGIWLFSSTYGSTGAALGAFGAFVFMALGSVMIILRSSQNSKEGTVV